jgi:alpha-beta hydrolase superfamily lysophospholipase
VLHGTADVVTDIEVSQALYAQASSSDKTIRIYTDGCHALLQGEPDDQRQRIAKDIIDWIDKRAAAHGRVPAEEALVDAENVDGILQNA